MAKKSLRVDSEKLEKVKRAFERTGWTQDELAQEVDLRTRQPIGKFLSGKPVERKYFQEICFKLGILDWKEVAYLPKNIESEQEDKEQSNAPPSQYVESELVEKALDNSSDIDILVQEVRSYCHEMIQDQCGTMRSLTMSQPIDVSDLYTNVNILEKIPSRQWREVDEMVQDCTPENFHRIGLGRITGKEIPGLEAVEKYSKLMVLGKPGSGKTTFLKHLATQCNTGKFQANRVPIFITFKQFAEVEGQPSLLEYITQMFSDCDVSAEQIAVLLKHGKTLVLLDGLDEVKLEDNSRVIKQIRDFSDKFRRNQFVMTCRIAAKNYNFEKFTDVEVTDFDDEQINTFAHKWFKTNQPAKTQEFIQQLSINNPIRELATNPLLLTLLCLIFEESNKFPVNRSELYEEGVDILLKKWDKTRKIQREQIYKNLSVQRKKDLLSQIALTTFERGNYFFKQKELEQYISDYIHNLPDAQNDPVTLQLDSEAVLKSIEAQHGLLVERAQNIYSFSHLTFQEYFTARAVIDSLVPQALEKLFNSITKKSWREVFLLVSGMMRNVDFLLEEMKKQIDELVTKDEKMKRFFQWINQKSLSFSALYEPCQYPSIRIYYFKYVTYYYEYKYNIDCLLDGLAHDLCVEMICYCDINHDVEFIESQAIHGRPDYGVVFEEIFINKREIESELKQLLQELQERLEADDYDDETFDEWWRVNNGQTWTEQFRAAMIKYRNIGHDWQFNTHQQEVLDQYYDANLLLLDCLNSGCNVTHKVRSHIEETLLLPIIDI